MGDNKRSLLGHYGDMFSTDDEYHFYVDPLEGLSEAEAAFRIHYRKVLDFKVSIPIDEDTMGDFVNIALKAAALRAGTKAAKIPMALVDECIDSFSNVDRRLFFETLRNVADVYSTDETAVAATFFQDVVYFSYYSRSWELIPEDIEDDLYETYQFDRDWYASDVALINDYKATYFLHPDAYMKKDIECPDKFQSHSSWAWYSDSANEEDDSDSFAENFAGSIMDAILADSKTDPLSSDYKPEEDSDEEDSDSSVSYNVYWSLDPSALPPNPAPKQEEEGEDND